MLPAGNLDKVELYHSL